MTAKTINHPGTATPSGGSSAPSGGASASGGTPAPFPVNPQALVAIGGDPVELQKLASTYAAGADKFQTAHSKVQSIHDSVFPEWEGAASREGERATSMAIGRSKYALDALTIAHQAISTFATTLAAAQAQQTSAAAQINQLQPQYLANPTNASLAQDIKTQEQRALSAQQDAAAGRTKVEAALVHSSTVQWYTVPAFTSRFDPVTAGILDSLVAHKWVSRAHAQAVAGSLKKLSKSDYEKFSKLESTATSDKERGKLYTELASGKPMSKIVASDKTFHTAPKVTHTTPVATTGATSVSSTAFVPAAAVPAVAYRPTSSSSSTTTHDPAPAHSDPPPAHSDPPPAQHSDPAAQNVANEHQMAAAPKGSELNPYQASGAGAINPKGETIWTSSDGHVQEIYQNGKVVSTSVH